MLLKQVNEIIHCQAAESYQRQNTVGPLSLYVQGVVAGLLSVVGGLDSSHSRTHATISEQLKNIGGLEFFCLLIPGFDSMAGAGLIISLLLENGMLSPLPQREVRQQKLHLPFPAPSRQRPNA